MVSDWSDTDGPGLGLEPWSVSMRKGGPAGSGPTAPAAISTHSPTWVPGPPVPALPRSHLRPSLRSAPTQPRARVRSGRGSAPPPPPRPAPATAAAAAILAPRRLNNNFIDKRRRGGVTDAWDGGVAGGKGAGPGQNGAELTFALLARGAGGSGGRRDDRVRGPRRRTACQAVRCGRR